MPRYIGSQQSRMSNFQAANNRSRLQRNQYLSDAQRSQFGGSAYGVATGGLAGAFQAASDQAFAANQARYDELRQLYQDRFDRNTGRIQDIGTQARADVNQGFQVQASQARQNLTDRGLGGTTIGSSVQAGIERERQGALNRVDEQTARLQTAVDMQASGDLAGMIERVDDIGPDMGQFMSLAEQYGYATGGGSGGMAPQRTAGPTPSRFTGNGFASRPNRGSTMAPTRPTGASVYGPPRADTTKPMEYTYPTQVPKPKVPDPYKTPKPKPKPVSQYMSPNLKPYQYFV